jgi:hypothetical protein
MINVTINATSKRQTSAAITPSSHQFLCCLFSSTFFAASAIFAYFVGRVCTKPHMKTPVCISF